MTMKKITVSLPVDVAEGVQALVDGGAAPSFSAFVAAATKAQLDREAALAQLRAHTGGPRGGALRARAERALGIEPAAGANRKAS
jgi:Arc/MetJ-type ribon-helix-helix transcriptional regulator